ncbi:hypothetical protein [Chromobacterium sphagni]|uniref:Uncharacterized protein n=1 Tax=Chromobacterium sphagni TaxID=1903179 RepID=A0A1S1X3B8_9NEIS|nr:hypothetical protein [Chromobacterium sphagni]OHX13972.1 hypothetical protein BI347_10960 [Chromobacterium sphagni]OHX20179.1 hypothetical protein BI344_06645 [Chromobacterium sphagni]
MKLHYPHLSFHLDGDQLLRGPERWADITLQGWQMLLDRSARRQAWRRLREHRLGARRALASFACWLSGSLVLVGLAYLLYLVSTRW